ncbi:nucleotide exchange factor GrpE [Nocardia takedensis]|uniref:nucleotide exchange factor GrpE n=1 Tax=Nocardia takedensis TaxID=259390 RepID=UPI0002E0FAC2|nr:nucleotide exchange factor GrpE [Nocardia takedensis]
MTDSVASAAGADDLRTTADTAPAGPDASPDRPGAGTAVADLRAGQADLAERVEDLSRILARQAGTLDRLVDDAKARDRRERQGADLPLVTELFALLGDTRACAATAESDRERAAFAAVAARVERLLVGRGGILVDPAPGEPFDSLSMEAADVVKVADAAQDRTVDTVLQPGLSVPGRSVRPARVVVRRSE